MASYHLRLKRDRKPDGSRVDAIAHAEYVNREGKYQDYDAKKDIMEHLSGNFIFTDKKSRIWKRVHPPLSYRFLWFYRCDRKRDRTDKEAIH